jgi:hypothetical protein
MEGPSSPNLLDQVTNDPDDKYDRHGHPQHGELYTRQAGVKIEGFALPVINRAAKYGNRAGHKTLLFSRRIEEDYCTDLRCREYSLPCRAGTFFAALFTPMVWRGRQKLPFRGFPKADARV